MASAITLISEEAREANIARLVAELKKTRPEDGGAALTAMLKRELAKPVPGRLKFLKR